MKTFYSILLFCLVILTMTAYSQSNTWTYKADMSLARTFVSSTVFEDRLYVIGGSPSSSATGLVEAYDPVTNTWSEITYLPSARSNTMSCTYQDKIYVFGGGQGLTSDALKSVFVLNLDSLTWSQKADMPYAIGGGGIALVEDTIYIIGGALNTVDPPIATVMAYHPESDTWTQKADMPTARALLSACVINGKIYAMGGSTEDYNNTFYDILEVYDPSTDSWTQKSGMLTGRYGLKTLALEGFVYAIGGRAGSSSTVNEVYNPETDTWKPKEPMQQSRISLAGGVINNKIYVAGGHLGPPIVSLSSCEEYTPDITPIKQDFNSLPDNFLLLQNYPNPFNPSTTISFSIPEKEIVSLRVFNVMGEEVSTLINEERSAGSYSVHFDAEGLSSGIYFYSLQAGNNFSIKKMILLK